MGLIGELHELGKDLAKLPKKWRYVAVIVILVIVISGSAIYFKSDIKNLLYQPSLSISSPHNGAVVSMEQQVIGVAKNIPEGSKVRVVVRADDRYYAQPLPNDYSNGTWTCNVGIGVEGNWGKTFDIIVVFANYTAQNVLTPGSQLEAFPPLGAKEYAKITVSRETLEPTPTPSDEPIVSTVFPKPTPMSMSMPTPTLTSEPSVTITSLVNAPNVEMWEWVSGTAHNIPDGQELWIVVRVDGLYFPHKVETPKADGTWRHNVQIGQKNDGGKRFDLIVVLADSSAQKNLQEWYKNQDDLYDLPSGTTRYSTVTVTRNSVDKSSEPSVTIHYPSNNNTIGICEWVSGTAHNIPDGYKLWIVIRWDRLYFPMYDEVKINTDETWMYNTTIGQVDDGGRNFEIIAVLVDGSAQAMINEWNQASYDLYRLFPGMTPYSTINITRK